MHTITTRMFGTLHVGDDGAYVPRVATENGRTRTPSLFVGQGLGQPHLDTVAGLLDGDTLDGVARDAIAADLAREPEGVVQAFVAFHREELGPDAWRAIVGDADLSPSQSVAHLELVGVGVHVAGSGFSLVLDYSFGKAHSDELLAVAFDEKGRVVRVSHES